MHILAALLLALVAAQPADLVLRHGAVYTMDASRSWAETVAVRDGRIVFVGADRDATPFVGPKTRIVELDGKMVLPGFHDSHVHPITSGMEMMACNLGDASSAAEVFDAIRTYAAAHKDLAWIRGSGWQLPYFPNANPTREQLDAIVPDRPALLWAADGHSAWVNSKALQIAGVTKATPDPPNGRIERNAAGEPTGTLREDASELVASHLPKYTKAEYLDGLRIALRMANGFGITSLYEADASEELLEAYAELDRRGELTARVFAALHVDVSKGPEQVARLVELRKRFDGKNLHANAVKIFADGVIEAHTAALLEPYVDTPGNAGKPNLEPAALNNLVIALDRAGFQIHIHAIGDRAIRMSLDAFEAARKANGPRDGRHHIAHLELIDPADIPRFRELGVIANFQPLWAYADTYIKDMTEPQLGPARSRWLYPIGSVLKSGGMVVGGSDWSVSSMNPLEAIQVAVTRRGPKDADGKPWIPEELADLPSMLAAYTINGAYLVRMEHETGSIEVGKSADLVVLERNVFTCPPAELGATRVVMTLLAGEELAITQRR